MRAYALPVVDVRPRLMEAPKPTPAGGEILIRILASSVNPVDEMVADGFFRSVQEYRFPAIFGRDLCGVVEQLGAGVTQFSVGDTVWGFIKRPYIGDGTFAEFVTCDASRFVAPKPDGLSEIDAGTMGLSAVTALECLDVLNLSDGDSVLINGATGGVGSFAVQIAAARKLRVIATSRPGKAEQYVRTIGAHEVIDWTTGSLADSLRDVCPDGVTGVVDLVRRDTPTQMGMDKSDSHAATSAFMARVLKADGRFASVTNGASEDLLARGVGFNVHSEPTRDNLDALNALIGQGLVRGCVTAAYPLSEVAQAFAHQHEHGRGKTAVVIDDALWEATRASWSPE